MELGIEIGRKVWANSGSVFEPDRVKGEIIDPVFDRPGIFGALQRGFALSLQVIIQDETSVFDGQVIRIGLGRLAPREEVDSIELKVVDSVTQ
jgi:hypothetical protein